MTSLIGSDMLISQWMCNIKKECSLSCPNDDLKQVSDRSMALKDLLLVAFVNGIRSISLAILNSWLSRRWRGLSLIHSTRSVYVLNSGFSLSQGIQFSLQLECIQVGVKGTDSLLHIMCRLVARGLNHQLLQFCIHLSRACWLNLFSILLAVESRIWK